ncbi:hypothetical protein [Sorangium sp. So ce1024]|uniref:hypothetical protein n=1 Tax=Sorangium sp. So ce1024 TaxID=3133327 RepID=UPI003EFCA044
MTTGKDWTNSSLGERLTWAMSRKRFGTNELGEAAGITGGGVSKLADRTEVVAGHAATLFKLANALDVSPGWLAFGTGQPLDESAKPPWERAADLCREAGVPEEAIQSALDEVVSSDTEMPVLVWIDRMRLKAAEIRAARPLM